MFTQLKKVPALLFALVALVAVSCNTNDGPVDPGSKPGTPTALKAQSRATGVGLKWDAPASGVTPSGYRIYYNVTGTATKLSVDVAGATNTSGVVTGLIVGTRYEFTVQALNGTTVGDATAALEWAPANRTVILKLYSSQSASGSGLIVFSGVPRVASTAFGELWDLCFDDKDSLNPAISSPGVSSYVNDSYKFITDPSKDAKIVYMGREYTNVNDLNDIYETVDLKTASTTFKEDSRVLSTVGGTGNIAFVFAQKNSPASYTFGKVLVRRSGTSFIQGSNPNKFIEVEVSYQTTADVPYALKAKIDALESQPRMKNGVGAQ